MVVISLSPDKFQPECFRVCFSPYRSGEFCQCDAQQFSDIDTDKCKSANETGALVCSGNGECDCGVCRCNLIPVSYSGTFIHTRDSAALVPKHPLYMALYCMCFY